MGVWVLWVERYTSPKAPPGGVSCCGCMCVFVVAAAVEHGACILPKNGRTVQVRMNWDSLDCLRGFAHPNPPRRLSTKHDLSRAKKNQCVNPASLPSRLEAVQQRIQPAVHLFENMVRVSHHGGEESSWAPETEVAPTEQQVHDSTSTSTKVEAADSSDQWRPQWNNASNAALHPIDRTGLSTPCDLSTTPRRRRDQYVTAVAMAVTPDDLFSVSVSSASTNETARTSNKSHSPSNSAYGIPFDARYENTGFVEDAADDTSSAYFARSPFTIAPITPSSTVMSYSSSDMEGSSNRQQQHSHNRDSSFVTETTMDYDNSTVGTSSAVAVLYQGYASSSVAEDTCTTNGSAVVATDAAVQSLGAIEAAMRTPPGDHFIRDGDPGTEWNTPNILSNEDSTLGGGEMSVGGVLKLLEEGDGDEGNLVPYRKKPNEKDGCCTAVRRKRILLLGVLALSMVCLVVGLYVATPKNRRSTPSESRAGSKEDDEDNVFSTVGIGIETSVPSLQPRVSVTKERDVATSISVSSSPHKSGKDSADGDEQSFPKSREEDERSPSPTSLPTEEPALLTRMDDPSPAPTIIDYCGDGQHGNGVCLDSNLCCSTYGWCGTGPAYCIGI